MIYSMIQAFFCVSMTTIIMSTVIYHGIFESVITELGQDHYAEKWPQRWQEYFSSFFITMPLNTIVNIGYIIVGAYYCARTSVAVKQGVLNQTDSLLFYMFNIAAAFYGVIQTLRILAQKHEFAVMDQWYTLPFFMWTFIWSIYLVSSNLNLKLAIVSILLSLLSYFLALCTDIGFEIVLTLHIFIAVSGGIWAYTLYSTPYAKQAFLQAIVCCTGFVVLKLLDLELPRFHPVFNIVSGHFISKVADVMQIYYVNVFFITLSFRKTELMQKKSS